MVNKNFLKGAKIVISDHALMRYLVRAQIYTQEEYNALYAEAKAGDKMAQKKLQEEKDILKVKLQRSTLSRFLEDGIEERREVAGSKRRRCTFIVQKKGNLFILITTYLQGRRNDFWKVGISKEVVNVG